jgi:hypothetical protein
MQRLRLVTALPLLAAVLCCVQAFEMPPEVYRDMQKRAPEFLKIRVKDVRTKKTQMADRAQTSVTVTAIVDKAIRSKSGLKPKQTITIRYTHTEFKEPIEGPSQVPVLTKLKVVPAYLSGSKGSYSPAAGGYSFETVK